MFQYQIPSLMNLNKKCNFLRQEGPTKLPESVMLVKIASSDFYLDKKIFLGQKIGNWFSSILSERVNILRKLAWNQPQFSWILAWNLTKFSVIPEHSRVLIAEKKLLQQQWVHLIIFRLHILYGEENYWMTRVVSFQTNFANLEFILASNDMLVALCVSWLRSGIFESVLVGTLFYGNLYGKVAIDHVPNFRRPKNFRRESTSGKKQEMPKTFRSNRQIRLATKLCAYGGFIY